MPEEKIVKEEIKEPEKIEIPINCDLVYESPKYNSYEHNYIPKGNQVSYDTYDYTGIFFQKPSEYLESIEPVKVEQNEQSIISDAVSKIEDSYIDTSISNQEINEKTNKSFNLKNKLSNLFEIKKVDVSNDTITNECENIIEENEVEVPNIIVNEPQIINQIEETKEETHKENKLNTIIESFNKLFESKKLEDTKVIIPNILVDQVEVENNNLEKVDNKSNIKDTLNTTFEDNDSKLFIPEVEQTKVIEKDTKINIPKFNIKETFKNLFEPKKVEETKEESYRIPLFESLSDDALLNCFVPVEAKKEESLISKLENRPTIDTIDNVTIKLDGENLLNKYNSGEQLDVIEYKILKEYLMSKQGN